MPTNEDSKKWHVPYSVMHKLHDHFAELLIETVNDMDDLHIFVQSLINVAGEAIVDGDDKKALYTLTWLRSIHAHIASHPNLTGPQIAARVVEWMANRLEEFKRTPKDEAKRTTH